MLPWTGERSSRSTTGGMPRPSNTTMVSIASAQGNASMRTLKSGLTVTYFVTWVCNARLKRKYRIPYEVPEQI